MISGCDASAPLWPGFNRMSGCPDGVGKWDADGLWVGDGLGVDGLGFGEDDAGVDGTAEVEDCGVGEDNGTAWRATEVHPASRQLSTPSANNGRRRTPNTVPWHSQLRLPRREGFS